MAGIRLDTEQIKDFVKNEVAQIAQSFVSSDSKKIPVGLIDDLATRISGSLLQNDEFLEKISNNVKQRLVLKAVWWVATAVSGFIAGYIAKSFT